MWIGIDPGASGAICSLSDAGEIRTVRLSQTQHDVAEFLADIALQVKLAVLEHVTPMPKQGLGSTFKFGASFGFCQGLLVANEIPWELVFSSKWQLAMKCRSGGDKNVTKAAAQRLFPREKVIHATADAMLLAEYAKRLWTERGNKHDHLQHQGGA